MIMVVVQESFIRNNYYYSFKIFPCFWLVKTARIIHHNQLLLTKFGKNLRHIEAMTSKVQPTADYWTDDVKMTSKVQPAADYWTVDEKKNWGRDCVIFGEQKNKERNGETPLRTGKYFEWIIKQLLNSVFVGYEEFCRSQRVLLASVDSTLLDLQNSSYPTQPHSIIANNKWNFVFTFLSVFNLVNGEWFCYSY